MKISIQDKTKLVNSVFSQVYKKYDLMNDIMSFGIHRIWKRRLIDWMNPQPNETLIDVASGTGDIAKLCSEYTNNSCEVICIEPNEKMLLEGKKKLNHFSNIKWKISSAECLPFEDETFDYYTISFGIRNVTNFDKSLNEAYRVLKNGGRFFCLEFSKVENEILKIIYENYSKIIPSVGKFVAGDEMPYKYLVKSIEKFYNQEEFSDKLLDAGFAKVNYRNLANGIAAIHSGWKIE